MSMASPTDHRLDILSAPRRAFWWGFYALRTYVRRYSTAQREAALTAICIAVTFAAILYYDLGGIIFSQVEHHADYKRDALILAGLSLSIGLAVFSVRRWRELTREVTVRIAAEARANVIAGEDVLTGLPNRRALQHELAQSLARSSRSGDQVSLLLLDLDRFKPVNDIHGHVAGDRLLQTVAERLRVNVRAGEFVARLGGDEFAIIVSHEKDNAGAAVSAAKRLSDELCRPVSLGSVEVTIGASSGIATFPLDAEDVETLMRRADVALYRAKDRGRGRCELFDLKMDAEIRERADIEADLRDAIANGGIVPHYQPLVDLRSGRIVGFEALARWEHPRCGFISPARFIAIAEESGLINQLGLAVLRQGCRNAVRWGYDTMLAVNISPIQLVDRNLADKILTILKEEGLPPARLEVELTENALVSDLDGARVILNRLKSAGVSICLDDFGAGYSSLLHVSAMPFNRVKIDRAFVQMISSEGDPLKVIRAIVGLCTSLGLACTGEGAETAEHVSLLRAAGCSLVQGWYFGKALAPGPAAELAAEGRVSLTHLHATSAGAVGSGVFKRSPQSPQG